ncbi:hypothetical protein [Klebsiella michiganensis]|uniref:hypothetical protein n=1 Tax=Klebsiella michiganensis TaxID=1134687 RepID=UPI003D996045
MLASAPFPARGVNALAGLPDLPDRRRGEPVARSARSPAKRSASREEATPMHHPHTVPEAALRACPGYRIADAGEPVAPVSS